MHCNLVILLALLLGPAPAVLAQGARPAEPSRSKPADKNDKNDKTDKADKAAKPKPSAEARAALQAAKELEAKVTGGAGPEREAALEAAAKAYEQVAVTFANEPHVAATARWEAGELWRRHKSYALAEQSYLEAARLDPERYGQRATLEAADMQRHGKRVEEAMATYAAAEAMGPTTTRAQDARLWRARLLQLTGKLNEAVSAFQAAVDAAKGPRQVIEAANWLAKAQIAKGDLTAAEQALARADAAVAQANESDVVEQERLEQLVEQMSARTALQRAKDKQNAAAKDASKLEQARKTGG